jgi:hypothetical protein
MRPSTSRSNGLIFGTSLGGAAGETSFDRKAALVPRKRYA